MTVENALTKLVFYMKDTVLFGKYQFIIPIILTLLIAGLISRKIQDWKILLFPISYGFFVLRINNSIAWLSITAIIFVLSIFAGFQDIAIFSTVKQKLTQQKDEIIEKSQDLNLSKFFRK